jgi:O-antigen ligase/polysaccharide polymerase Wzy-like membrane protein
VTAPAESRLRLGALWPLVPAAAVVGLVVAALTDPLLTAAGALGAGVLAVSVRWPRATALCSVLAGPLFLSAFTVGPMTLDNVAVLYGTVVAVLWLLARPWHLTPLAAWPASLAVAAVLAALANAGAGTPGVVRFASLAVLVLVLANSDAVVRARTAGWAEAAVTLGALVLLAQPFTGFPDAYGTAEGVGERYGGLFGHPNFAAYTVSTVVLYQLYTRRFTAWRIASAATLVLALVLTGSRAALLVFVLLLIPALWMRAQRFFALLLPAVAALPFVGTTVITRLESITATGGLSGHNASGWRFGQWQDALEATRGHEFWGIGYGQTASVMGDGLGAHSTYVQLWLETGRIGTVIAAVGAVVLIRSARGVRPAQVLLAYVVVTSVSDPVLLYPASLTVLLVLLSRLVLPDDAATAEQATPDPRDDDEPTPGDRPTLVPVPRPLPVEVPA